VGSGAPSVPGPAEPVEAGAVTAAATAALDADPAAGAAATNMTSIAAQHAARVTS